MSDFLHALLPVVIAALPGLIVALFAFLKAHAASTPEKWDDEVFEAIETVAKGVYDREAAKTSTAGSGQSK